MMQRTIRNPKINQIASTFDFQSTKTSNSKRQYLYYFKSDKSINKDGSSFEQKTKNSTQKQPSACQSHLGNHQQNLEYKKTVDLDDETTFYKSQRINKFSSPRNLELDPRDEKVRIKFKSSYYRKLVQKQFKIAIQPFQDELRDWLVDVIEITTSIGYNHLNKEILSQKQVKNFVAKNVLQNIKEVFQDYKDLPLNLKFNLMKFINRQSYQIFDHIARKYPQTRSKGVSKRIKSKVPVIDNRQSNQFDFLLINNLHIKYRDDGDYSQDIMRIVNKLISLPNQVYDYRMELEDSNYEVFSQIMEYIFQNSIHQTEEAITNGVINIICSKKHKIQKDQCIMLNLNNLQLQEEDKSLDSRQFARIKDFQKNVLIGQKIPIGVPLFSEQDIQASKFKINDSSILRLLTKWAEQLRSKITNAEEGIYRRRFKFKNNKGKLINLEPEMKRCIYQAAISQMQKIQKQLDKLKEQNYYLQTIFAEEQNRGKYAKHDTKIGTYSAKLNQIASQYIFKYLNKLIHALLTIPRVAAQQASSDRQKTFIESVNLVTFKIGDMMRCKCSCSEQQFIKILRAVDAVHNRWPDTIKISRIKNRLETQNNDILINFLFGQKAQCQLQLSVLSSQKKQEKNSSKFSHLIYEIVRAELGPISQMASIVVQYDPLAYFYSKKQKLSPELLQQKLNQTQKKIQQSRYQQKIQFRTQKGVGSNIQLPFVCCTCSKLAVVHNPQFYYRDKNKTIRQCNQCISNSFSYSNQQCSLLKQHVLQQNFGQDQEKKMFFSKHVELWNTDQFIDQLKKQTDQYISSKWFPPRGYAIRYNQNKPKMEIFTCIFEPTFNYVLFANKNQEGKKNIIFWIKIHEEKEKKIKNIEKELKKFAIFSINNTQQVDQDGVKYFQCNKPGCCGIKINPGPILTRGQMQDFIGQKQVKAALQKQQSLLYFNYLPKSLDILEQQVNKINERNKIWKIKNTVQAIQAFQCQLNTIQIVNMMTKLEDLNIGDNPELTSLRGIEGCINLKYLNCSGCNLEHIGELAKLKKVQTLNFTNNRRLESIEPIKNCSELQALFLRNTSVQSLTPLQNCLKLQSLDLQDCQHITSISQVKSPELTYISIINCLNIHSFDLPTKAIKSLKTVQLSKKEQSQNLMYLIAGISMTASRTHSTKSIRRNSDDMKIDDQAINHINKILQIRRTTSLIVET